MPAHRRHRQPDVFLGVALPQPSGRLQRHPVRHIAVERIVRARLVGEHVGQDAAGDQLRQHVGGVADQPDRERPFVGPRRVQLGQSIAQVPRNLVAIAAGDALLNSRRIDVDAQEASARHRRGQRLRAAHAAHAGGDDQPSLKVPAEVLAAGLGEGLVGPLHDALAADIYPRAGGHLAVHDQPLAL